MGKNSKIKAFPGGFTKKSHADKREESEEGSTIEEGTDDGGLATPTRAKANASHVDISEAVENLAEKRYTTREKGLAQLVRHFQTSYEAATDLSIENVQESILTQVFRSVRRPPSSKEGVLCMQLLNLLALHFGADDHEFLSQCEKPLRHLVSVTTGELVDLRPHALSCLSFVTFVSGGVDAAYKTWAYCARILRSEDNGRSAAEEESDSEDDAVSVTSDSSASSGEQGNRKSSASHRAALHSAAATAWVLLATLRTPEEVLQSCMGDGESCSLLEPLLELLECRDTSNATGAMSALDIKVAAGKCVAYLWEVAAEAAGPASSPEEAGMLLCRDHQVVEKVLSVIKRTGNNSSKRTSKKDRKEQRGEFRAVEDLIFRGDGPEESLRMQGAVLEVASFQELAVVEALKAALGSGFHSSLRLYPVVKDILGIEYLTSDMDGAGHDLKVNKGSSADKSRSNYRKQDRRYRADFIGIGDDGGGYDEA